MGAEDLDRGHPGLRPAEAVVGLGGVVDRRDPGRGHQEAELVQGRPVEARVEDLAQVPVGDGEPDLAGDSRRAPESLLPPGPPAGWGAGPSRGLHARLSMTLMRAIALDKASSKPVLKDDVPEPELNSPDQLLIRVLEVGICGTDRAIVRGEGGDASAGRRLPDPRPRDARPGRGGGRRGGERLRARRPGRLHRAPALRAARVPDLRPRRERHVLHGQVHRARHLPRPRLHDLADRRVHRVHGQAAARAAALRGADGADDGRREGDPGGGPGPAPARLGPGAEQRARDRSGLALRPPGAGRGRGPDRHDGRLPAPPPRRRDTRDRHRPGRRLQGLPGRLDRRPLLELARDAAGRGRPAGRQHRPDRRGDRHRPGGLGAAQRPRESTASSSSPACPATGAASSRCRAAT